MRILNIGSGTGMFDVGCEDRERMVEYGKMVDRFDILASCCGKFSDQNLSDNVFLHATNSKHKLLRPIDSFIQGYKLIKAHKIDVIFCQDPLVNGLVGWLLSRIFSTKLLVSVFGTSVFDKYWQKEHWYNYILKFVGIVVMKDADVIQTDGFGNYETLQSKYGQKAFWKPIVPSDIHQHVAESKKFINGQVRVAFVGRMAKQKNIAMLAEVVRRVSSKKYSNEVFFSIVGDGSEKYFFNDLKETANVKLIDRCSRQEIADFFKNNDILIMTSYYEGLPRVFIEAAVNGLAFVVTDVSGSKNVVQEGENGFIIKQEDIDDFVRKLELLIEDSVLLKRFSDYTINNFSKKYSYELNIEVHRKIVDFLKTNK